MPRPLPFDATASVRLERDPSSNVVDVYVGYLRRKLGDNLVRTVRGAGYRLEV